ncbi:MAG: hypothetical protein WCK04_00915 [Actinomycetes bacterium]
MTIIYWIIERLLVNPVEGSDSNVVITADWRCNGSQDSLTGTSYGSVSFAPPSGDFTPYDQLTEAQVLGWCWDNGVDKAIIEASVEKQIADQANPPVVSLPLPWTPVPVEVAVAPVEVAPAADSIVVIDEPIIVSEAPVA